MKSKIVMIVMALTFITGNAISFAGSVISSKAISSVCSSAVLASANAACNAAHPGASVSSCTPGVGAAKTSIVCKGSSSGGGRESTWPFYSCCNTTACYTSWNNDGNNCVLVQTQ